MSLEQILGQRYRVIARLPAQTSTHQRYKLESAQGTGEHFVLSYRDYSNPLGPATVAQQEALAKSLARPPLPLLCRALEWRMGSDFQYVVSESPGELSLRELLQSRQSLKLDEAENLLRQLADGCEAAVKCGWPRFTLDPVHLSMDERLGTPRIPLPDVPSYDAAGPNALTYDPLQTMQFNAAELSSSFDLPPKDTRDYIHPLAILCCDLLGQPQSLRGGNARYQPIPQLSSNQNVLLRRALTTEGRTGFKGAKAFMDEFFGPRKTLVTEPYTEHLRTLTVTISTTEANVLQPVAAGAITVKPVPATAPPQPPPLPINLSTTSPLRVQDEDLAAMEKLPKATRLRFVPEKEGAPVLALTAESQIIFGRSAVDADFVAQFRPRTSLNDARSRRISRGHGAARLEDGHILFEERDTMNPTVHTDGTLHTGAALDAPAHLLLAGEYPLEMHRVLSDYEGPRQVEGHPSWSDTVLPQGSLVARPAGPGVLLWEAALVLSDVGIHFSTSGRPWFRVERDRPPPLRIHHLAGHFWIEVLDEKALHLPDRATKLRRHDLVLLSNGLKIQLGTFAYAVQNVALGEAVAS